MIPDAETPEPRDTRRLSDRLTAAFYDACRIGDLDAAKELALALRREVARSESCRRGERREDGNDVDAVYARLRLELRKAEAETPRP